MTERKRVDLNAAQEPKERKKQAKPKSTNKKKNTNAGIDGSSSRYDLGHDKAEREAAKQESTTVQDDDDMDKGFAEWVDNIDWKKAILTRILPGVVAFSAVFALGMCAAPTEKTADKPAQKVDNVEGAYSILDKTETLKDDQNTALRKQISALQEDQRISSEELAVVTTLNTDAVKTLDPFFDAVIGIDPQASEAELATHQRNLSKHMTNSASTSTLYQLLSGSSPARELNTKVRKSGTVIVTWLGVSDSERRTYRVSVPLVSEDTGAKAEYVVSLVDGRIDGIDYLGLLDDTDRPLETAYKEQLDAPVGKTDKPRGKGKERGGGRDGDSTPQAQAGDDPSCADGARAEMGTNDNGKQVPTLC